MPARVDLLVAAAQPSTNTAFHATCVAAVVTGAVVLVTAGDLGPFAPTLLALGLYAIFFGLFAEAAYLARHVIAAGARRLLRALAAAPRPAS